MHFHFNAWAKYTNWQLDTKVPETAAALLKRPLFDALRRGLGVEPVNKLALLAALREIAPQVLPYAKPVWKVLNEARRAGKRILFEGAQGALLDVDHGTYPYVTSSNTVAGQAAAGSGLGPKGPGFVLGIASGFTSFVAHAGSPPINAYMIPLKFPPLKFTATMAVFFFVINLSKWLPYGLLGLLDMRNMATSLVLLPLAPLGVWVGVRWARRISSKDASLSDAPPAPDKSAPRAVIAGVIDILRTGDGPDASRKWASACVLTGECIKVDGGVNHAFL